MLSLLRKDGDNLSQQTTIWFVPLTRLEDNPYQTRAVNDLGHVVGLAASILQMRPSMPETKGLQSPPVGRLVQYADGLVLDRSIYEDPDAIAAALADGTVIVELGFGHSRRLAFLCLANGVGHVFRDADPAAATALTGTEWDPADYAAMPVTLRYLSDREMWEHAITENAQRRDLTAIEEAIAIERARKDFGMTYDEAGRTFGKSRSAAANLVRLLQLPEPIQQAIMDGTITERHGRALLALKPAPHLYDNLPSLDGFNVASTEALITGIVRKLRPLPPAPGTGYHTRDYSDYTEKMDPPWDYDWVPADDHAPGIVGACNGCQWRATFAGDAGPRCSQPRPKGGISPCYDRKATALRQLEVARQAEAARAAIRAAAAAQAVAAEEVAARAALERKAVQDRQTEAAQQIDKPIAEWNDEDWQAWKEAAAATLPDAPPAEASSTPAPAAASLPDAPVADGDKQVTFFGGWQAPAALVERGLCSQEKCECFVLAYDGYPDKRSLRPDPEHAPNMCYGCTSAGRLAHRKKQLEHGEDLGAKRAAIKAENAEVLALLKRVFYALTAADIWNNAHFLADFAYLPGLIFSEPEKKDALQMQEKVWMTVAAKHCKCWDNTTQSESRWNMEHTQDWLKRLGWQQEEPQPPAVALG